MTIYFSECKWVFAKYPSDFGQARAVCYCKSEKEAVEYAEKLNNKED